MVEAAEIVSCVVLSLPRSVVVTKLEVEVSAGSRTESFTPTSLDSAAASSGRAASSPSAELDADTAACASRALNPASLDSVADTSGCATPSASAVLGADTAVCALREALDSVADSFGSAAPSASAELGADAAVCGSRIASSSASAERDADTAVRPLLLALADVGADAEARSPTPAMELAAFITAVAAEAAALAAFEAARAAFKAILEMSSGSTAEVPPEPTGDVATGLAITPTVVDAGVVTLPASSEATVGTGEATCAVDAASGEPGAAPATVGTAGAAATEPGATLAAEGIAGAAGSEPCAAMGTIAGMAADTAVGPTTGATAPDTAGAKPPGEEEAIRSVPPAPTEMVTFGLGDAPPAD